MKKVKNYQKAIMITSFLMAGIFLLLLIFNLIVYFSTSNIRAEEEIKIDAIKVKNNQTGLEKAHLSTRLKGIKIGNIVFSTVFILGAIINGLAGWTIMQLTTKQEHKALSKIVRNALLTPEEKTLINILEENNNEMTQTELVRYSKLSKVKVSRIIKRLESLKVISKYPYGMTNKIRLEKEKE